MGSSEMFFLGFLPSSDFGRIFVAGKGSSKGANGNGHWAAATSEAWGIEAFGW